jgi:hypothetical protein
MTQTRLYQFDSIVLTFIVFLLVLIAGFIIFCFSGLVELKHLDSLHP